MRFGYFLAPYHTPRSNPTLALERDLELGALCDRLGFDEFWVGEHHSGGFEIIGSPEIFVAALAERTRHIRLGTGVVSVPYHNPFHVASRAVLLDHLNRALDQNSDNIDELLENVRISTENLKGLTETLRSKPASLIRGIHVEDRQPGGGRK